jgi:hypothetical protein
MSMRICKACGCSSRKLQRAIVFGDGGFAPGMVCAKCAQSGMLVVAVARAPKVVQKLVASAAVDTAIRTLKTLALAAGSVHPIDDFGHGRIDGFESAIEVLKASASKRIL